MKTEKYRLKRERALSYSTRKPILYKQFSTGETAQLHHTFIDSKQIYFVIHILRMFQKMQHANLSLSRRLWRVSEKLMHPPHYSRPSHDQLHPTYPASPSHPGHSPGARRDPDP